jgi:hypothetical protein
VQLGDFRKIYQRSMKAEVVEAHEARMVAEANGGFVVDADIARQMGANLPAELDPAAKVVMSPRQLNAQQLDEVSSAVDDLAGLAQSRGAKDTAYVKLAESVRETQEQFPGLREMKERHAALLKETERSQVRAGLPSKLKPGGYKEALDPNQQKTFDNALKNYRNKGSDGDTNLALRELAELAGVTKELKDVAGTRFGLELGKPSSGPAVHLNPINTAASWLGEQSLRADPAFRRMASYADGGVPANIQKLLVRMRKQPDPNSVAGRTQARGHIGAPMDPFGLSAPLSMRGGGLGTRAASGYNASTEQSSGQMTPEDRDNLRKLIQAVQTEGAQ